MAAASPRASLAGCTRAQCRREARAAAAARAAPRARRSCHLDAQARAADTEARELGRRLGDGERPPLTKSESMPSFSQAAMTSSTVSRAARSSAAIAASSAPRAGASRRDSPISQPPLRPEAPKPANSFSRTTTASDGRRQQLVAVHRPV